MKISNISFQRWNSGLLNLVSGAVTTVCLEENNFKTVNTK